MPAIFRWLGESGRVPEYDLRRALNMGIGMILVVAQGDVSWRDFAGRPSDFGGVALVRAAKARGVRVGTVVQTIRHGVVVELEAEASGRSVDEVRAGFTQAVSLQTFVDPADIASMICFVCSPAGAKISGQALTVDGNTESARS